MKSILSNKDLELKSNVKQLPPHNMLTNKRTKIIQKKNQYPIKNRYAFNFLLIEVEAPNLEYLILAKMLKRHLNQGKKIIVASPAAPEYLMQQLSQLEYDFNQKVTSEQMILFSYQSSVSSNISLSADYAAVFNELKQLSGIEADLIILLGVDMLFNLESQNLAYTTINKFFHAIQQLDSHVIAQFIRNDSTAHNRLVAACSSLIPPYVTVNTSLTSGRTKIQLKTAE